MQQVSFYHPTIWKFLGGLKGEQDLNETNLEKINSGQEFRKTSKKYEASATRLKNLVTCFDNTTNILDDLRGIAHNLRFKKELL